MHVPMLAALAHAQAYGSSDSTAAALANVLGSHQAISIFRGDGFDTATPKVELLCGEKLLPVCIPPTDGTRGYWTLRPNTMRTAPRYGSSGFGNTFNNYTWTMGVFNGALYVGTMDWSYLLSEGLTPLLQELGVPVGIEIPLPKLRYGADLWRFPSPAQPALPESVDGVGNYANYGIRTMVSDDALYLGTANPMNLMTDVTDDRPEGGWELLRLTPKGPKKG